jgi:type IX secretion system PorP/SprF family membrane protein
MNPVFYFKRHISTPNLFLVFALWASISSVSIGQDIQFSQFYAVPTYQNPAFAGSAHALRGIAHSRLQWPGLDANFNTAFVGVDHFFSKYNSGAGIYFLSDWAGKNTISTKEIHLQYSYNLPVSEKYSIRAGLQAGGVQRNINYNGLTFPTQWNSSGYKGDSTYSPAQNLYYADLGAGALFYGDRIWAGLSAHHLNTPNQSFAGDVARLPMQIAFTGGYKIPINSASHHMAYMHDAPDVSITPTFHYKAQGKSDQLDLGLYAQYNVLLAGVWYRGIPIKNYDPKFPNNESIVLLLGWKYKDISISYSYDITVSKLNTARPAGAHELNITYIHSKHQKQHKPMKRLPCPSFYKH